MLNSIPAVVAHSAHPSSQRCAPCRIQTRCCGLPVRYRPPSRRRLRRMQSRYRRRRSAPRARYWFSAAERKHKGRREQSAPAERSRSTSGVFQPQLVRDHSEDRLETDGEQRQAGENEAGFGFIQADDVRQPDRQKRKAGGHDEEVEKEEQPENPEVGVVLWVQTVGFIIFSQEGAAPDTITRVADQSEWRFPGRGWVAPAPPAAATHRSPSAASSSMPVASAWCGRPRR